MRTFLQHSVKSCGIGKFCISTYLGIVALLFSI
ncbi:Uncharacterised protein [Segatella copri]|nr:Uncharacterised protein [Segatella copri]